MKRQAGVNWMCFGIFVVMLVVLVDSKLTVIPDVLTYIVAVIGALLFFVGAYKNKKNKIKDKECWNAYKNAEVLTYINENRIK